MKLMYVTIVSYWIYHLNSGDNYMTFSIFFYPEPFGQFNQTQRKSYSNGDTMFLHVGM